MALKKTAHQFAREVMRPIAKKLDAMTAEEAVADGSPSGILCARPTSRASTAAHCRCSWVGEGLPLSSPTLLMKGWPGEVLG